MDVTGFKNAMVEGFCYSLSTQTFGPELVTALREALTRGDLHRGLPRESPAGGLLGRAFLYFDQESRGCINEEEFMAGMAKASSGDFRARSEFLFFVTDANGDGMIGEPEVEAFFMHFTSFYYNLARNVLDLDLAASSPNISRVNLERLKQQCEARLDASDNGAVESISEELFQRFDANHDHLLSHEEWLEARAHLPGMYNKLASLMAGIEKGGCMMYRDAVPGSNVDLEWGEEGMVIMDVSPSPPRSVSSHSALSSTSSRPQPMRSLPRYGQAESPQTLGTLPHPASQSGRDDAMEESRAYSRSPPNRSSPPRGADRGSLSLSPGAREEASSQRSQMASSRYETTGTPPHSVDAHRGSPLEERPRRELGRDPGMGAPSQSLSRSPSYSPDSWARAGQVPLRAVITPEVLAAAFEDTEFTEAEEDVLVDLYEAYAAPEGLIESSFNQMMLEAFAYAVLLRPPVSEQCRDALRLAVANGRLGQTVDFANPLFWRTFQFFDSDRSGVLNLRKLAQGMWRMAGAEFQVRAEYAFFLTDLNDSGGLTEEQVLDFFTSFMDFYTSLSINVASMVEEPFLLEQGVSRGTIAKHIAAMEAALKNADAAIMEQFEETFRLLDEHMDKSISFESWISNRHRLPKMYNKVLSMARGVLYQYTSMFRSELIG